MSSQRPALRRAPGALPPRWMKPCASSSCRAALLMCVKRAGPSSTPPNLPTGANHVILRVHESHEVDTTN